MGHSTLPALIDVLLAKIAALPQCAPPWAVFDGTTAPNKPDRFVLVGATADAQRPLTDGQQWTAIGARRRDELLEVPVTVSVVLGGSNTPGAGDAQKAARDAAFSVVGAIEDALRADVVLANGTGAPLVFWAEVAAVSLLQSDPLLAARGRGATVELVIQAHSRI